jgi:hypothetical protein
MLNKRLIVHGNRDHGKASQGKQLPDSGEAMFDRGQYVLEDVGASHEVVLAIHVIRDIVDIKSWESSKVCVYIVEGARKCGGNGT